MPVSCAFCASASVRTDTTGELAEDIHICGKTTHKPTGKVLCASNDKARSRRTLVLTGLGTTLAPFSLAE